jgi:GntR family transcriptional regulator/MocR family aminotransferase
VRGAYARRREALLLAVARELVGAVEVGGSDAGLHLVLWLRGRAGERAVCARARELDVGVYPMSPHYLGEGRPGLLIGYGALDEKEIGEGIRRLARAFS